jgi:hypothetical protein
MARLPSEQFLVQMVGNDVAVFEEGTEYEVVRFDVTDPGATARAQKVIHDSTLLSAEDKCFAHFWCGYFHAHVVSL